MECPPRVASLILQILRTGILRIRVLGWDEHAAACAVEADHLHNLPDLLLDFRVELLDHYSRITREIYIAQVSETVALAFAPLWQELEKELAKLLATER